MKSKIILPLFSFCLFVLIALSFEIVTRLLFPNINRQDTQLSLFREKVFGDSFGWQPNATGTSFDVDVIIDDNGFRKMAVPDKCDVSWLILGDSVTFGVGIKTGDTFVGMLKKAFPNIRIWNTAVVGYSIENYKDVIDYFIDSEKHIQKVLLFFTINDLYKGLNVQPTVRGFKKILFFLKRNSKFYILVKNLLFDRSESFFFYDYNLYDIANPKFKNTLIVLDEIKRKLIAEDIDFIVILLPYEYQIRKKQDDYLKPQKMMSSYFKAEEIQFIDTYQHFIQKDLDSKTFFLYADPMHLSKLGHQVVFDILVAQFNMN